MTALLDPVLLLRIAGRVCALPLTHVAETMRPLAIDALAGAPPFVLGVSLVRGQPTPVVGAGALLAAATDAPPPGRFVTVRSEGRVVALAVDEVLGVATLPSGARQPLPALLADAGAGVVDALARLDRELLLLLDAARFVPDEVWATLAGRDAS